MGTTPRRRLGLLARDPLPSSAEPPPPNPIGLVTVDWVTARLHVPASWIYAKCTAGQFPHVRIGRYLRFEPAAVDAFVSDQRVDPSPSRPRSPRP